MDKIELQKIVQDLDIKIQKLKDEKNLLSSKSTKSHYNSRITDLKELFFDLEKLL